MRKLLCVLILPLSLMLHAQKHGQELIDSLKNLLPASSPDSSRVRIYHNIYKQYYYINADSAKHYAQLGLDMARQVKWEKGIAVFYAALGGMFSEKSNYDSAIFYQKKALAIHERLGDQYNKASALQNIGVTEQNLKADYPKAAEYYFLALKVAESINNPGMMASCYASIARIYSVQDNYQKSLEFNLKALTINERLQDIVMIAETRVSIAISFYHLKDSVRSSENFEKALQLYGQIGSKMGLATTYTFYSALFGPDYLRKIEYALKAKLLWEEVNPYNSDAISNLGNLGVAYLDIVRYDTLGLVKPSANIPAGKKELLSLASFYVSKTIALSKETLQHANETYFTGVLAEIQEQQGDFKNAYYNFRIYQSANDSIFSQENKNRIAALEGEREVAIRDKQLGENKLQLANQRQRMLILIGGIGLLAIAGGLLYRLNRIRKKTNTSLLLLNNQLDEANKVKAKFFAILSHDLRSPVANLINFLRLQQREPGLLSEQQAAGLEKKITHSAESLLETMEAMLLWSKGQMENFKPQIKEVAVADLFDYLQRFFAGTEHIEFVFEDPGVLKISTDENYLQTIMHNLTSNAVKALGQTAHARISWSAKQETSGNTILSIADNGPGVTEDQIKALYDDTAVANTRTGLGLHLVRDLARAIGCKISLQPAQETGTRFTLSF